MKKLGLIVALALLVTVGGVYATFNYAQGTATAATEDVGSSIAQKAGTTNKGEINIDSTFAIHVDDVTSSLKTGCRTEGYTKVTFTPATGADSTVTTKGIKLKLTITIKGTNSYNGTAIYVLKNYDETNGVLLNDGKEVLGEISVDLSQYISVSEISLPTAADYDAYKAVFDDIEITFTISEA